MGEILNSPKGVKSGVPERVSITPWFAQNNCKQAICHSWWTNPSTYVTRKCHICEQVLYDDHRIFEKLSEISVKNIPASITLKPE